MSDNFWVYGLTYPSIGVFYVGYTCNPWQRFAAHWSAQGDCSSYRIIRFWKKTGQKFGHIIYGEFAESEDARRLERALILRLPGLVNDKSPQTMLSPWLYPPDWRDEEFLTKALAGADFTDRGGLVDQSGEFMDERYDELDLVDGP